MASDIASLILGGTLCAALVAISVHYFRRDRKARVEEPKYRMLEDDDR